jgi:hypothetical protein
LVEIERGHLRLRAACEDNDRSARKNCELHDGPP